MLRRVPTLRSAACVPVSVIVIVVAAADQPFARDARVAARQIVVVSVGIVLPTAL